ncbi:putative carboxylesterase 15 [Triticum urartu]|uniref:Putative carboxylesterase 15 n=1 Tax=Triticum urartu TaxID=4572 RepID=M7ZYG4_TRIUA|nr:putative carboxylesterase 15 [Triticum urartu]
MSGEDTAAPQVLEDLPGVLKLLSDGSVVRGDEAVLWPEDPLPDVPGVQWKDAQYHAPRGLSVRVYRPASSSDVLRDRVMGYAARLREMGKAVEVAEFAGEQHGFSVLRPFGEAANELMRVLKRFVYAGTTRNTSTDG